MPTYVTPEAGRGRTTHLGDRRVWCGQIFLGPVRRTEDLPPDRAVCRRCVNAGLATGVLADQAADALLAHQPVGRDEPMIALLRDGHTDASVARRLGISLRTLHRRITALKDELGARTRFDLGYRIASRDHTTRPTTA